MSAQPKKYKSLLQELCQKRKIPLPVYSTFLTNNAFSEWTGTVEVDDKVFIDIKSGVKKKELEECLAQIAYDNLDSDESTIIINPKSRDTLLIFDYSLKRVYDLFVRKVACNNVDVKVLCEESISLDHDYIEVVKYSKGEHFMIELTMLVTKSIENSKYNKIIIVSNRKKVDHLVDVLNKGPKGPSVQKVNSFDSLISILSTLRPFGRDEN